VAHFLDMNAGLLLGSPPCLFAFGRVQGVAHGMSAPSPPPPTQSLLCMDTKMASAMPLSPGSGYLQPLQLLLSQLQLLPSIIRHNHRSMKQPLSHIT
jgi:hypothetical protein